MKLARKFAVEGKLWRYPGPSGWYFLTIGKKEALEIKYVESSKTVGWGYIRISAKMGRTKWSTTLFPTKEKEYLLALKASVRKAEKVADGDIIKVEFSLEHG
jgi:hypothetical protein